MNDVDRERPGAGERRFTPRPRTEPDGAPSTKIDRHPQVRAELETILVDVERIVSRGESAFLSEDDRTNYLAGSALIIHFDDIAQRRLTEQFRKALPGIPWQQITATRNILAHNYTAADRHIVWLALSGELPQLIRKILGTG